MVGDEHFIEKHHIELIQRVRNVGAVLDRLLNKKIISQEIYSEILRKPNSMAQMREILGHGNIHGSPEGKDILYEALVEEESFLMGDLV
ncbi:apoptosis-associated speck-like protein containing a CARD [Engraulis encrasicolus]|uniref:apoptosis-associated speck-like protein containing a CARD n=1 Tax=Engraulis encrasicolus TaxID=184585 RepID=UPI002FCF2EDC